METDDTVTVLREEHGDDCAVMCIGPAGENLVRFAGWINEDDRAAGRGGTGAVGGSKNLKAIVIKGDKANQPKPVDRPAFREADRKALAGIMNEEVITAPRKGGLSVYGTNVLMNMVNVVGALPAKNSQSTPPLSWPRMSPANMSARTSSPAIPPVTPVRWPARRNLRSRTASTRSRVRATSTNRPGRWAPTA